MQAVVISLMVGAVLGLLYIYKQQSSDSAQPISGTVKDLVSGITDTFEAGSLSTESNTPEPTITPWSRGIARAEGFNVSGSLPQRSHNPGDLTKSFGFNVSGVANKEGVLIFASDNDGWSALEAQRQLIANGQSRFTLDMAVQDFAAIWTLGRLPQTQDEVNSVNGWVRAFLQEVGQGLTATSAIGDDTASWSA